MTHYMELLASNQPWNLIIFMAIPVILAETIAISELYLLYTRNFHNVVKKISKWSGIAAGLYFLGIFLFLFKTVFIPLTLQGEWRGFADVIAVSFYLLGVFPLMGIALTEMGIINKNKDSEEKLKSHAIFVAIFLVVAHVAMIFGMVNPDIFSSTSKAEMQMEAH
jgi:hypothetical protein